MSATTSPDSIVYPVSTDLVVMETVFSAMATSIQNAFNAANNGVYTANAASWFTVAANWTLNVVQTTVTPQMITIRIQVTRAVSGITVGADGNIANTLIGTINQAKLRPLHVVALATDTTGPTSSFYVQSDGAVYMAATQDNNSIVVGDSFAFSGTYIKAGI